MRELFRNEFWLVAREDDALAKLKAISVREVDAERVLLLEETHCLRDHAIMDLPMPCAKSTRLPKSTSSSA